MRIDSHSMLSRILTGSWKYWVFVLLVGLAFSSGAQTINTESFDGTTFPPAGWSQYQITLTGLWTRVTSGSYPTVTPHSGAALATFNSYSYSSGTQAALATPQFDLSNRGANTPTVSFWMYIGNYSTSGPGSTLDIYVSTQPTLGGPQQSLLGTLNSYNAVPTGWTLFTYNIPAAFNTGSNYIIFKATGDYWNNIHLDDVTWISYGSPMAYSSSTAISGPTSPLPPGAQDQAVLGLQVVVTGSATPISVTSLTFNTTGSTAPTTDINLAEIYYTGNSSTFAATNQFGADVVLPNGTFTVPGTVTLLPGTNYFWLAYDLAPGAVVGHVIDGQCTSLTAGGSVYTPTVTSPAGNRTIAGALSGVYTIDPNGTSSTNFISFNDAINTLNLLGVAGPVTFNVAAATYNESMIIRPITGASATNTITFNGGTGNAASRIINSATTDSFVVKIWGADYIHFQNLTFNSNGTTVSFGIWFCNSANTYPGLPCDYNEVSNCVINNSPTATSSYWICILGSGTSYSTSSNAGNYNLIQNNQCNGGYYGILFRGYTSTASSQSMGNQFIGNTVTNAYYYGMYLYYQGALTVQQNTIVMRDVSTSQYGLYTYYCDNAPQIIKNYVRTAYMGIYTYYCNRAGTARMQISNNMIDGIGYPTYTKYLQYLYYCLNADVWYNTYMSNTTSTTYGCYVYGSSTVSSNHDFRNNIFSALGASGTAYLLYNTYAPSTGYNVFTTLDYNLYYSIVTPTFYLHGSTYTSLAAVQAAVPAFNQNSKWGNPYFLSNTDLHSRSTMGYQGGTPIAAITTDIDGQARNPLTPCIGADEFPQPPPEKDIAVLGVFADYSPGTWSRSALLNVPIDIAVTNIGLETNPTSLTAQYQVGANPPVVQTFNGITWNAGVAILSFTTPFVAPAAGNYTIVGTVNYTGDGDPTNNTGSKTQYFDAATFYGNETFDNFVTPGFNYLYPYSNPGFNIFNGGGVATWQTSPAVGIGGSNALEYPGDVTAADDWVFFPAAFLEAGSSYRVKAQYRTELASNAQTFEIYAGTSPNPASMQLLVNGVWANKTNTAFAETRIGVGTYPYFNTVGQGNYYVGIHVSSPANRGRLFIDNVTLDVNPAPPPKIGIRYEFPPTAPYMDDPVTAKIDLSAIYRSPGVIDRRYQVTNTTNLYGLNGFMLWNVTTTTPWIRLAMDAAAATPQPNPFSPAWPRENQYFHLVIDPSTLAPGTYHGVITFMAELWNQDYPSSGPGLDASNQPFNVPVNLTISTNGTNGATTPNVVTGTNYGVGPHVMLDGTGNKVATVNVTSGLINQITITEYPNQMPPNYTRLRYVRKYWTIAATGTGWTADVEFYYTDTEALAGGIVNRDNLRGWNQAGKSPWAYAGTGSVSDPPNNAVMIQGLNPTNIAGTFALATRWNHTPKSGADGQPATFSLDQNYPNPFNPSTKINFSIPEDGLVTLTVYNSMGSVVATLVNEVLESGSYNVNFDAATLPAGMYVYRLTAGTSTETRYMSLVK